MFNGELPIVIDEQQGVGAGNSVDGLVDLDRMQRICALVT
jgi:hypothetical protein